MTLMTLNPSKPFPSPLPPPCKKKASRHLIGDPLCRFYMAFSALCDPNVLNDPNDFKVLKVPNDIKVVDYSLV